MWDHVELEDTTWMRKDELRAWRNSGSVEKAERGTRCAQTVSRKRSSHTLSTRSMHFSTCGFYLKGRDQTTFHKRVIQGHVSHISRLWRSHCLAYLILSAWLASRQFKVPGKLQRLSRPALFITARKTNVPISSRRSCTVVQRSNVHLWNVNQTLPKPPNITLSSPKATARRHNEQHDSELIHSRKGVLFPVTKSWKNTSTTRTVNWQPLLGWIQIWNHLNNRLHCKNCPKS